MKRNLFVSILFAFVCGGFLVLAIGIMATAFTSCNYAPKHEGNTKAPENAQTAINELVGVWERRTAEVHYSLSLASDGTGKLLSYGQASTTTQKFSYTVTDNGIVVEWDKLSKETYHAVLTVDGKYLVLDNGSNVYVYKKRGK